MKKKGLWAFVIVMIFALTLLARPGYAGTGGKTREDAVSWANSQIGQWLDYDGYYGAQCVDLIAYYYKYLGQTVAFGNANAYVNGGKFTPSGWTYQNRPQAGDIAVWTSGRVGHIGIVTAVNGDSMTIVEQNYIGGSNGSKGSTRSISISGSGVNKYIRPDFPDTASSQTNDGGAEIVNRYYKLSEYDEGNYSGEWKNGAPNGFGRLTYDDKNDGYSYKTNGSHAMYYEGEFVDGRRYGKGKVVYEDGSIQIGRYFGKWQAGKRIFEGRFYYPDGSFFEGYVQATSGVTSEWFGATISDTSLFEDAPKPQKKIYTVSYDANGGYNAPSSQTKTEGETLYLTSETPSRTGYEFQGWSKRRNATFYDYSAGSSYSEDGDQTLYAVWSVTSSSLSSSSSTTTETDTSTTSAETTTKQEDSTNLGEGTTREAEPNDKVTEANYIETNTMIAGSLLKSSDIDWFEFVLPEDGTVSITFGNEYVDSSSIYWKTGIYNSENKQLKLSEWAGNKLGDRDSQKIGLPAGTYYLKIEDFNFSSNEYHFMINYEETDAWEKEFNQTPVDANDILPNTQMSGTLVRSDDVDWYRFIIPEDGYLYLTFGNEYVDSSITFWKTTFYDDQKNQIFTSEWTGNALADRESWKFGVPAGSYYLKVEDYNFSGNEYWFAVNHEADDSWESEFNNTPVSANRIELDEEVNGSIVSSDDADWYVFDLPEASSISLTFGSEYLDSSVDYWKTTFFDGKKKEIKDYRWKANELTDRAAEKISLGAGTYYLKVEDHNHTKAAYHFTVNLNAAEKQDQKKDKKIDKTANKGTDKKNDKGRLTDYVSPHFERITVYYLDQFSDVPSNQWYTENVAEVFELGLMKGDNGLFNPYGAMTVAEAVTLASRIHRIYYEGSEDFGESSGEWYQVYLDYALQNDIISKAVYNSEVLHKVTRAQFVAILSKSLPNECFEPINTVSDGAIPDVGLSDRHAEDIYKLYRSGILRGSDANGTFNAATFITRAEVAAILSRMVESDNREKFTLE